MVYYFNTLLLLALSIDNIRRKSQLVTKMLKIEYTPLLFVGG